MIIQCKEKGRTENDFNNPSSSFLFFCSSFEQGMTLKSSAYMKSGEEFCTHTQGEVEGEEVEKACLADFDRWSRRRERVWLWCVEEARDSKYRTVVEWRVKVGGEEEDGVQFPHRLVQGPLTGGNTLYCTLQAKGIGYCT